MMKRDVGAELDVQITAPTTLEFQIAVAPHPGAEVTESLSFELDGKTIDPDVREIAGEHGNRIHMLDAPVGNLKVTYSATVLRILSQRNRFHSPDSISFADIPAELSRSSLLANCSSISTR